MNDKLFRNSSTQRHTDKIVKFVNSHIVVVTFGTSERVTCRHSAGNNGHFVNIIIMFTQFCKNCMACFVISSTFFVCLGNNTALFLGTHDDFIDSFIELEVADHIFSCPGSKDGRLIEQVCKIRSGETARHAGNHFEIDIRSEGFIAGVNLEDRLSALDIGKIDIDLSVKTTGTKQRTVENVRTVGCRHDNDTFIGFKTVHLNENLVESLFTLVVTATKACPSLTSDSINFVDEDNAGLIAFCHIEQVTHTRGTNTDIHFHEVRTADREERNPCFPCNGFCKQGFTCSGRAYKQNTLRNLCSEIRELFRALQEFNDFLKFFLFLLCPGNVREPNLDIGGDSCLRLAEVHYLSAAAAHGTKDEEESNKSDDEDCYIYNVTPP